MICDFEKISKIVNGYVDGKRYSHTLYVTKEAYRLGTIFMPDKAEKLALAGLLHDITKQFSLEKQLELCEKYDIIVNHNKVVPKLLHAKTGAFFARELLGDELVDDEIFNGIYYHTTGQENMSLFQSIIYLADYIEESRSFVDCVVLRKYFYDRLKVAKSTNEKLKALADTMIESFNLTIQNLIDERKNIDFDTIKARNYFLANDNVFVQGEV